MKRSLIPDTLFMAILKEQQKNLFVKSYNETMINSFADSGKLAKQLQQAFYDAFIANVLEYKLAQFQVEITGYFERVKDKVSFQFSYTYDPKKIALNLTSLKATMNDEFEIVYPIQTHPSRGLLPAQKVYQELLTMNKKVLLKTVTEKFEKRGTRGKRTKL